MNLQVHLGDRFVGTLLLLSGEQILFSFAEEYVNDPNRPVLSQYYRKANGELRQETRPTRTKLPPWFSNLLPEGPLLEYIAKHAGIHPIDTRGLALPKQRSKSHRLFAETHHCRRAGIPIAKELTGHSLS